MKDTNRNDEWIAAIRERLTPERFEHSLSVADSARHLAQRFGADADKAYTAGILHDIMKDAPKEEQLQALADAGVVLTRVERANPKLWHAMAGAVYLRERLGVTDEEILGAVRYHTTARGRMSLLEKVLYIADFISADRDYEGVDALRAAAEESLERAMLEGMQYTITDLASHGRAIHPDSIAAYNEIVVERAEAKQKKP